MTSAERLIPYFRGAEEANTHAGVILVGDLAAQRLVAAWSTMAGEEWTPPSEPIPVDLGEGFPGVDSQPFRKLWEWLWEGQTIDWETLAERSGMTRGDVERVFERLRGARLVYPDGTVAKVARGVLQAQLRKVLVRRETSETPKEIVPPKKTPAIAGGESA